MVELVDVGTGVVELVVVGTGVVELVVVGTEVVELVEIGTRAVELVEVATGVVISVLKNMEKGRSTISIWSPSSSGTVPTSYTKLPMPNCP